MYSLLNESRKRAAPVEPTPRVKEQFLMEAEEYSPRNMKPPLTAGMLSPYMIFTYYSLE